MTRERTVNELYTFEMGGKSYYYSDGKTRTYNGQEYTELYLDRTSGDDTGAETQDPNIEITMDGNCELIRDHFLLQILPEAQIHQYNIEENTVKLIDCGSVSGITRIVTKGAEIARLVFNSVYVTELSREIPTRDCGSSCNNDLGDRLCGVNLALYTTGSTPIQRVNGTSIRLAANLSVPRKSNVENNYFRGGDMLLSKTGERRKIISSTRSGSFVIQFPFHTAVVGDTVSVTAGCDKTLNGAHGCVLKFNNKRNFFGFNVPDTDSQTTEIN